MLVAQLSDHSKVLSPGEVLVHRRVLPGQPDTPANRLGVVDHVQPHDSGPAGVGPEDGGQDAHYGRLAGAIRTQQAQHAAGWDVKVHPVDGDHGPEVLDEAFDRNDVFAHGRILTQMVETYQLFYFLKIIMEPSQRLAVYSPVWGPVLWPKRLGATLPTC